MLSQKISIITATFNAAETLPGLIESIRAQSDKEFEWVIVDGASTDRTVSIIKSASDVVSRWISEPDFGVYDAMNKAIKMAEGEYYLVCGADDTLFPDAVKQFKESITASEADIVTAWIGAGDTTIRPKHKAFWLYGTFTYISGHSVGTLIRRSLHDRYGYYSRRFPISADQFFLKKAIQGGATVVERGFVAGTYSLNGLSSMDTLGSICEFYRVQMETEKHYLLQTAVFLFRLIKNFRHLL